MRRSSSDVAKPTHNLKPGADSAGSHDSHVLKLGDRVPATDAARIIYLDFDEKRRQNVRDELVHANDPVSRLPAHVPRLLLGKVVPPLAQRLRTSIEHSESERRSSNKRHIPRARDTLG